MFGVLGSIFSAQALTTKCSKQLMNHSTPYLRVLGHGYCAAVKECADLGFVVN